MEIVDEMIESAIQEDPVLQNFILVKSMDYD
jgi:hypothetical protein